MTDERVMIFIDGSNFYHCVKDQFAVTKVDFRKLQSQLCGQRRLIRTYYYNAPSNQSYDPAQYKRQQKFFHSLKQIPYFEVKLGRLAERTGGPVEKGVDVKMAVDIVHYGHQKLYDTAVLVTGDADFAYAAQAVKNLGIHVENAFVLHGHSAELRDACDIFTEIDRPFLDAVMMT